MYSKDEIKAVTNIQAAARGFLTRRKYQVKQLKKQEMESYQVNIKGNDPVISGLPKHGAQENIALIGTSGMRSVEIACQLSHGAPKVVILDNSKQVIDFWRTAREIMKQSDDPILFLKDLKQYVNTSGCANLKFINYAFEYLENLFKQYGFDQIKQIIIKVSVIGQSWGDEDVLIKLRNILTHNGITIIYVYPSNIAAYVDDKAVMEQVLKNIQKLNPAIAIHTDLVRCPGGFKPEKAFLITDYTPSHVKQVLNLKEGLGNNDFLKLLEQAFSTSSTSAGAAQAPKPEFRSFKKDFLLDLMS